MPRSTKPLEARDVEVDRSCPQPNCSFSGANRILRYRAKLRPPVHLGRAASL